MKTGTLLTISYCLVLAVLAVWWLLERQVSAQIHQENAALLGRLSEAIQKLAENQRLPDRNSLSMDNFSDAGAPLTESKANADNELLRLRSEIAGLLEQHQQTESLREDTRQTLAALEDRKKEDRAARRAANPASQLEIIKAQYWTDHTNMDVTDELQDRIRGDNLKAVAGNDIKGDPEYGQTKHLTIEYRFGGVTRTNEFREGDVVVLPAQ